MAWRVGALSPAGATAATVAGAAVHAGMGTRGSITMLAYFASSSSLGRLPMHRGSEQRRGNRRDAVQVLANGGPAVAFSLLHMSGPTPARRFASVAFYGSLAAAAADTWATEIGTRWGGQPRSIATGRRMLAGDSGGVTVAGVAASVAASFAIASVAQLGEEGRPTHTFDYVVGGVAGSLADSLLGALVQERRWCDSCHVATERPFHTCGQRTRRLSGIPAINNDVVNLLAVAAGGCATAAIVHVREKLTRRNGSRVEFVPTSTSSRLPPRTGES